MWTNPGTESPHTLLHSDAFPLSLSLSHSQGPEIRTGMLKDGKPIQLTKGKDILITTDYTIQGDASMISMSYKSLAHHVHPGMAILCADGSITLNVLETDTVKG